MPGQDGVQATFADHLGELRLRLFYVVFALLAGSGLGYYLHERLLSLLLAPLKQSVYYTTPAGGFSFVIQISLFFGLVVSIPIVTFNVLRFVQPALPARVTGRIGTITLVSCLLSLTGILFAYWLSLPAALKFLADFSGNGIQSLISAGDYFSFVTRYLAGTALVFQLPLTLIVVNKVVFLRFGTLMRHQWTVLLVSFIVAAVLTPTPDPVNQAMMALPIVLLYQVAVVWIGISNINRPRELPVPLPPRPRRIHDISRPLKRL